LKPYELHRAAAPTNLKFYVVTVSTSRFKKKQGNENVVDESGDTAERLALDAGHSVVGRELIPDDNEMLRKVIKKVAEDDSVDVLVLTGGTGISPNDITIETVRPFLQKEIDGFGELLRRVSFEKIGAAAVLSRATAGIVGRKLVLCLPGSPDAVSTALGSFIGEIPHALQVARA
jgi:molybdenum cofactor biosynthesis protein B